jgi:creatinine amidohydrolase
MLDSLADSWAQAITELHQLQWVERTETTWERGQWAGDIQTTGLNPA